MKRKCLVFLMVVMVAGTAWGINDQSIKGENTFGLLEDNFDLFFYPGYLADFDGYEIYTNLHNTSGANRFQIGWFGLPKKVPGKLFLMFDTTRSKTSSDVWLPPDNFTPQWPNFLDPQVSFVNTGEAGFFNLVDADFFDYNGDRKTDRSIQRNFSGESWSANNGYDLFFAYGIPIRNVNLGVGFTFGYLSGERRDSLSTFDISYIDTDLVTNTILERYTDRASGRIDTGGWNIGFIVGAKFEPVKNMKLGADFYYNIIDSSGAGKYASYSRSGEWERGSDRATMTENMRGPVGDPAYGNIVNDALPYDGSNAGIRLKTYFPIGDKNILRADGVIEFTFLDVSKGVYERMQNGAIIDSVNNERTDYVAASTRTYSGDFGTGNGISLLLADIVKITPSVRLGFGIGYEWVKRKYKLERAFSQRYVERVDTNNDGDSIYAPLDDDPFTGLYDTRTTQERDLSQSYRYDVKTHYLKFPVALEVDITKRLFLRLGVSHFIIVNRADESLVLISGSNQTKITTEEGERGKTVTYTPYSIPQNTQSSAVNITSITDYRIGLGFEASKNISIDLLGNYTQNWDNDVHTHELAIEPHEGSNILTIFGSATIRF